MAVDFNNLPCELGSVGALPEPTVEIDGGSVDIPDDDGVVIVIQRIPNGHPTEPPSAPPGPSPEGPAIGGPPGTVGGPGTGDNPPPGGGGSGIPTGPGTGIPGGPSTGPGIGDGPSTGVTPRPSSGTVATGFWVCRNGTCVFTTSFQTGDVGPFGTQAFCQSICQSPPSSTGVGGGSTPPGGGGTGPSTGTGPTSGPPPGTSSTGGGDSEPPGGGGGGGGSTGGWVCRDGQCLQTNNPFPGEILFGTAGGCAAFCRDQVVQAADPRTELSDFEYNIGQYPEYDIFDDTYLITEEESSTPVYKANNENLNLLSTRVDRDFAVLAESTSRNLKTINDAMGRISKELFQASLNKDISLILYGLSFPDGRAIPESKITRLLATLLFQGKLTSIPADYILLLRSRAVFEETIKTQVNFIQKSEFGISRKELNKARQIALTARVVKRLTIIPDPRRSVDRALANMKTLNPLAYTDLAKEYLRLWYILPEDINRRIMVDTGNGESEALYIKDNNTIPLDVSNVVSSVPVNYLTFSLSATTSDGTVVNLTHTNDIHRAVTIPNIVEQACLFDAGEEYKTELTVSSPPDLDLELTYSLTAPRQAFYILELLTSTISDVTDSDSILIKRTQARYKITNSQATIRELVKYRIYPWKVFPIHHEDPILGHFNTQSTFTFKFTNFNMQKFGNLDGEPLFVRRIPQLIVILPTDKFNYNFYNGFSRLDSWETRTINFTMSPDSRYSKTGLDKHWLKVEDVYPGVDVDAEINVHAKKGTYTARAGMLESGFNNATNSETLPRAKHGFRAAYEVAAALYANYNVQGGLMWSDIFTRLTPIEYQTLKLGIPGFMIERLRRGEKTGVQIFHNRTDSFIRESRLGDLKDGGTEVPIKLTKESSLNA